MHQKSRPHRILLSRHRLLRAPSPVQILFTALMLIALDRHQTCMGRPDQVMVLTQARGPAGNLKVESHPRPIWMIMLHPQAQRIMQLSHLPGRQEKPEVMGKVTHRGDHLIGMNSMDHTSSYNDRPRNILPNRRETYPICQLISLCRSRIVSSLESMIGCHSAPLILLPNINFQFLSVIAVGPWSDLRIENGQNGCTF
jgi:hypothetical protein